MARCFVFSPAHQVTRQSSICYAASSKRELIDVPLTAAVATAAGARIESISFKHVFPIRPLLNLDSRIRCQQSRIKDEWRLTRHKKEATDVATCSSALTRSVSWIRHRVYRCYCCSCSCWTTVDSLHLADAVMLLSLVIRVSLCVGTRDSPPFHIGLVPNERLLLAGHLTRALVVYLHTYCSFAQGFYYDGSYLFMCQPTV